MIAAIRREDGRWLLIRRSEHVPAPGKVCFPGGGIEIGEDIESALIREMREELGVAINPVKQCWKWDSPDKPLTIFGWIAELLTDDLQPEPTEVAEILWLTADEAIEHPDAMPTNRDFVTCLMNS